MWQGTSTGTERSIWPAANFAHATLAILLGKGDGTFNTPTLRPTGASPSAITAADFNSDTLLDLAVANSGSNNVQIFIGDGAGAFTSVGTTAAGTGPAALAVGDLNGDAFADLTVANEALNDVSVLLGGGNGTFTAVSPLTAGVRPFGVAVQDLDADGDVDIVAANAGDNSLSVLRGNGDGTFSSPIVLGGGSFSRGVAFADFNDDDRPDIASVNGTGDDIWITLNRMGAPMDLTVAITNNVTSVTRGEAVTYDVTVGNRGPMTATAVQLSLALPPGLLNVMSVPSVGTYDSASGAWTGISLAPGEQITMAVTGVAGPAATGTLEVTATVAPEVNASDPFPGDNTATDSDIVFIGGTDLAITVSNGRQHGPGR